ncbi:MAG: hypothetical protein R6U29_10770 [Desulfosudaceae bacterium]
MKQYVIDELRPSDYDRLKSFLDNEFGPSSMGGIYWIPLPDDLLTETQASHNDCRPFFFIADLDKTRLSLEFLVRTRNSIRCSCIAQATPPQREWLIRYIDTVFDELDIIT